MVEADLLSVLIGAIVVDTVIIGMNYGRFIFVSDELTNWYTTYRLSAMIMDVLIIVLYTIIGLRCAETKDHLIKLFCIIGVQFVGDLLFYVFFTLLPEGAPIFDTFQRYSAEVGGHALWADALMMAGTYFTAHSLRNKTTDTKIFVLLIVLYISQYVLHIK